MNTTFKIKSIILINKDTLFSHFFYLILYSPLLIGCTPKISPIEVPVEVPPDFSVNGEAIIPDKWWTVFGDEKLNVLVDSALVNNMDLASVWYQLQASRAVVKRESTFLLPDIEAGAQTAISRPEPDFTGGETTQIGISTNYEVDLWGRIKASIQAEEFNMQASYYDYQAAAMSISAEIARLWFQLIAARQHLNLTAEQISNNQKIIDLIQVRFGSGQIKGVDILRQRQLLEEIQEQQIGYKSDLELLKNRLAILTGEPPQSFEPVLTDSLPGIPPQPEAGLPLDLVRRRPDLQREYNALMAADRDMAVAVRNKFPRLSLNLSSQARSNTYNELFSNWAYTLGANLFAPLIYWGRLNAEVDRTEAVKNQRLYLYGQSVLTAFREVEDALIREQTLLQRIAVLENRVDMAKKINNQLNIEFLNGYTNYLDVLLSLDQQQQLERDILDARLEQYQVRIDLYLALAGDFDTAREQEDNADLPN